MIVVCRLFRNEIVMKKYNEEHSMYKSSKNLRVNEKGNFHNLIKKEFSPVSAGHHQ